MISNMAKLLKYENDAVMDSGFLVLRDAFGNPHQVPDFLLSQPYI